MGNIEELSAELYAVKGEELKIKAKRIALEEKLSSAIGLPTTFIGSKTRRFGDYKINVRCNMLVTIDTDLLRELATANNLNHELITAFRWKPTLIREVWSALPNGTTRILAPAITTRPGKTCVTVNRTEK